MYNGNVEFEGIAIEDLVHEFKKQKDVENMPCVRDIKDEFLSFIEHETEHGSLEEYLKPILYEFKDELQQEINEYSFNTVMELHKRMDIPDYIVNLPDFETEFHEFIPEDEDNEKYNQIIWECFSWYLSYEGSNLIFSGASHGNYYHSLFEVKIHCKDHGKLISENIEEHEHCRETYFKVFAENKEAYTFITGVDNDFLEYMENKIKEYEMDVIDDFNKYLVSQNIENSDKQIKRLKQLHEKKNEHLNEEIADLKSDAIEYTSHYLERLPLDLVCLFGDYLIKSVALKQRLSDDIETISIETDICLMSNSQGFNWIKLIIE